MCLNYTCIIFTFFIYAPARFHDVQSQFVVFASAAVAHGIIVFMKKSIFYFMIIMYKHIFLNFGVISFTNKKMFSFLSTAHL